MNIYIYIYICNYYNIYNIYIYNSIYENSESNVFKNINFLGEISNNLPNDLLGTNVYKLQFF